MPKMHQNYPHYLGGKLINEWVADSNCRKKIMAVSSVSGARARNVDFIVSCEQLTGSFTANQCAFWGLNPPDIKNPK